MHRGVRDELEGLDREDLGACFAGWGYKPVHASSFLRAYHAHGGELPIGLSGLPGSLLDRVRREFPEPAVSVVHRQRASDGTTKLLCRLRDGRTVESVLMPDHRPDRAAGCVSSQVGCAMGCDFCATTRAGFERNLTAGEMVGQFLALRREAESMGRRLQTVVFMGMGEPLLNLEEVTRAVRLLADNGAGGLGWRQITVSTVGIVPGIVALAAQGWSIQLAVSLHAPDDETRARLIPLGRRYAIREVLAAADGFQASRGRPVIIQYCLLAGVNDSPSQARELATVLGGRAMHVNLLRYNPTGVGIRGGEYAPASAEAEAAFAAELRERGVVAHVRRSRGPEIEAACGQLRERMRRDQGLS